MSQYLSDVAAGTLPQVAFIEAGYMSQRDEHPSSGTNAQTGAAYVASLINPLMTGPSWKDSVFILTYDEPGGLLRSRSPSSAIGESRRNFSHRPQPRGHLHAACSQSVELQLRQVGFRVPLLGDFSIHEKEFCVPYRRGLHGDPEVHRNPV